MKKYNVITLCGSTRFKDDFLRTQRDLTLKGNIVIPLSIFSQSESLPLDESAINMLAEMHNQKIDMADEIYVINKDGYIGESTQKEIAYATLRKKKITYME